MTGYPTVSVILPAFNRLSYLRAAIGSVFEQTFRDWELLVADDGSGPEVHEYLSTLAGVPRVKLLWLSHTGNPPAVRNVALREAKGEYVAFLDSDDLWSPQKLQIQLSSLCSRGSRGWSYTGFILVDACGDPLTGGRTAGGSAVGGRILDQLLRDEVSVVQSSVVARREAIERIGGYDEELPVCGDYELWVRLATQSEPDFIQEPLVRVRRHSEHYSDDVTALIDLRRMFEKIQRSGAAAHLDEVLTKRRANVAVNLARRLAICKNRVRVLSTLFRSARYSWRYREWWFGALEAVARAFAPAAALRVVRRLRG